MELCIRIPDQEDLLKYEVIGYSFHITDCEDLFVEVTKAR